MTAHDPIARLNDALSRARAASPLDPTAAALATADARGRPSVRMVLVKAIEPRGISVFTNRDSRKARELAANPWAAIVLHWPALAEQARAEGAVAELSDAESDAYFATRPRASQLGAWASRQSEEIGSRAELEAQLAGAEKRFQGVEVPRPPRWGGYLIVPEAVEMWKEGAGRLHFRERFEREGGGWRVRMLQP
ncbi:MAG: pyridoxamine 5'-phosphate oxidase [Anaeromyxobacteraceae bacterium]